MGRRIQSHCWLGGHHGLCGDGELILSGYGTLMCMDFTWDSVLMLENSISLLVEWIQAS